MKLARPFTALALTVVLVAGGCGGPSGGVVEPPMQGAFFGAYVDPPIYTQDAQVRSFENFERSLGRKLAIFHNYHTWQDPFPSRPDYYFARRGTTLLLSWAGADTEQIVSGRYDFLIRDRAKRIAKLGYPVLLRWRWEMNRANLRDQIHAPSEYVEAWRHIHDIFADAGVTNVSWVWCPLVSSQSDSDYSSYYPGPRYVDWLCADGYAETPTQSFQQVFDPFLSWARQQGKPILIGEFGRKAGAPGSRASWLRAAELFVEKTPQIKAVCYFESPRGTSGNYAVSEEPDALAALRAWVDTAYFRYR